MFANLPVASAGKCASSSVKPGNISPDLESSLAKGRPHRSHAPEPHHSEAAEPNRRHVQWLRPGTQAQLHGSKVWTDQQMGVVRWVSGPVPGGVWGMVRRRVAAAVQAGPDTTQPPTPCPYPLAAPGTPVTCPHAQFWLALQVPPEIVRFRQWDRRRPSRSHPLHSFKCARGLAMSGEAMIGRLAPYLGTTPPSSSPDEQTGLTPFSNSVWAGPNDTIDELDYRAVV